MRRKEWGERMRDWWGWRLRVGVDGTLGWGDRRYKQGGGGGGGGEARERREKKKNFSWQDFLFCPKEITAGRSTRNQHLGDVVVQNWPVGSTMSL